jgi:hypothetical protein
VSLDFGAVRLRATANCVAFQLHIQLPGEARKKRRFQHHHVAGTDLHARLTTPDLLSTRQIADARPEKGTTSNQLPGRASSPGERDCRATGVEGASRDGLRRHDPGWS